MSEDLELKTHEVNKHLQTMPQRRSKNSRYNRPPPNLTQNFEGILRLTN